jgi:hypothetical protein
MNNSIKQFNYFSFLLFFLFGGAIIGETVSLSMAVSILGPSIISKLYLINGFLLLLLPTLFFQNIDKVNRGKLLSALLITMTGILSVYLLAYFLLSQNADCLKIATWLILLIYPISYLSKTILFLTFWTLANDIYTVSESKKGFPLVAAWGFVGGLMGACAARLLLVKIDAIMIIGLWGSAYFIGWFFSRKITFIYRDQLLKKEEGAAQRQNQNLFVGVSRVFNSKLIRLIAVLYFFVFIAVFCQDFLFWKKSSLLFLTPNSLASFQYTFYLTHALITILGLRFVMPSMIQKWGFIKIFSLLPITLFAGSVIMIIMSFLKTDERMLLISFAIIQFARYVVFENAFSPIYQMFFAAVPKEKRGRAKTFLEGIIKPCAIMISGIILIPGETFNGEIMCVICILSIGMIVIAFNLRGTYREALLPKISLVDASEDLITEIGSHKDQKIVSLIKGYSYSPDADVRSLAVKILARDASRQAFKIINDIFNSERNDIVRETIARSLKYFSSLNIRQFAEKLLEDENPRIRAHTLNSLNRMEPQWIISQKERVKAMLFDGNSRVQVEAAEFLWKFGAEEDKKNVFLVLDSLCASKNINKMTAGVYLIGMLKPPQWEMILLEFLTSNSFQVFTKCVELIFQTASKETQLKAFAIVEKCSRKHISLMGKTLQTLDIRAFDAIVDFLRTAQNQRMVVEMVHSLRVAIESGKKRRENLAVDPETRGVILERLVKDLEHVYRDSFVWYHFRKKKEKKSRDVFIVLEDALEDQLSRLCERILDVIVLFDTKGIVTAAGKNYDLKDNTQRQQVAEIIENFDDKIISMLAAPIIRSDTWDDIAKIGRTYFHFEFELVAEGLFYFINSKNKWVCFCAFYCIYIIGVDRKLMEKQRASLAVLQTDANMYLSNVAIHFLNGNFKLGNDMIEPFKLLEQVMCLKRTILFKNVSAEKLMELAEIMQSISYKSGTLISREGELSDHLYIVGKGSLRIVKTKDTIKTILSILHPGETYGEIGLFNKAPRFASAIANEDCELWVIQRSELKRFLFDMPEIAYNFLEVFSEKLRKSSEEVVELNTSFANSKRNL